MKTFLFALLLTVSAAAFGQITTLQTAQIVHTNRPGTIALPHVHKGNWLRLTVRWTPGGEVVGVFTDNFFDPWYPSPMNFLHESQEEFESYSKGEGNVRVNLYLYLHADVFYDIRLDEISK